MEFTDRYLFNKQQPIHTECICPICREKFIKKTKLNVFCQTKNKPRCVDVYNNIRKFFRRNAPREILKGGGFEY